MKIYKNLEPYYGQPGIQYSIIIMSIYIPVVVGCAILVVVEVVEVIATKRVKHNNATIINPITGYNIQL